MFDDFTCSGSTDATVHGISNNVIRIPENDVPHLQQAVVLKSQAIFKTKTDVMFTSQKVCISHLHSKLCENCSVPTKPVELQLCQINFREAMYLCTQPNCHFPLMEPNLSDFLIPRDVEQQSKVQKKANESLQKPLVPGLCGENVSDDGIKISTEGLLSRSPVNQPNISHGIYVDILDDAILHQKDRLSVSMFGEGEHLQDATFHTNTWFGLDRSNKSVINSATRADVESFDMLEMSKRDSLDLPLGTSHKNSSQQNSELFQQDADDVGAVIDKWHFGFAQQQQLGNTGDVDRSEARLSSMHSAHDHHVNDCPSASKNPKEIFRTDASTCLSDIKTTMLPLPSRQKVMLQMQNKHNSCWLDVLLQCFVNSPSVRAALNSCPSTRNVEDVFVSLCDVYDKCQAENCRSSPGDNASALSTLNTKRDQVMQLLVEKYQFKPGENQSAVEMFSHLLKMNSTLSSLFMVTIRWEFQCTKCHFTQAQRVKTEIISFLSNVSNFHPLNAAISRTCYKCNATNQQRSMIMEKIPPCLMIHFQQGLPHNRFSVLDFAVEGHLFSVCAVIQYVTEPVDHFVVWIRDYAANRWICYDDLKSPHCEWQCKPPKIPSRQIHMIMWEKQGLCSSGFSDYPPSNFIAQHLQDVVNEEVLLSDEEILNQANAIETIVVEDDAEDIIGDDGETPTKVDVEQQQLNRSGSTVVGEERGSTASIGSGSSVCLEDASVASMSSKFDGVVASSSCVVIGERCHDDVRSDSESNCGRSHNRRKDVADEFLSKKVSDSSNSDSDGSLPVIRIRKRRRKRIVDEDVADDIAVTEPEYKMCRDVGGGDFKSTSCSGLVESETTRSCASPVGSVSSEHGGRNSKPEKLAETPNQVDVIGPLSQVEWSSACECADPRKPCFSASEPVDDVSLGKELVESAALKPEEEANSDFHSSSCHGQIDQSPCADLQLASSAPAIASHATSTPTLASGSFTTTSKNETCPETDSPRGVARGVSRISRSAMQPLDYNGLFPSQEDSGASRTDNARNPRVSSGLVAFHKLPIALVNRKSKLLGTGCLYDAYKPKRSFKLAGYQKKSCRSNKRDVIPRKLRTPPLPRATFLHGNHAGSCESSDKSSETSELADMLPDFEIRSNCSDMSSSELKDATKSLDRSISFKAFETNDTFLNDIVASNPFEPVSHDVDCQSCPNSNRSSPEVCASRSYPDLVSIANHELHSNITACDDLDPPFDLFSFLN